MDTNSEAEKPAKKKRKEPERRNFDTTGILNTCLETLGMEFWDEKNPGFGLRISPKGKQVWMWRFRGSNGKEVPLPDGPMLYYPMPPKETPKDQWPVPRGKYTLKMARALFEEAKRRASLSDADRDAEDGERMTLSQAVPIYLENKRKQKSKNTLGTETKAAYLKQWKWLEPLAGHFVLKDTNPGKWKDVFEAEALRASIKRELIDRINEQRKGTDRKNESVRNKAQQAAIRKRLERGLRPDWKNSDWWTCLSSKEREELEDYLASIDGTEERFGKKLESSPVMQAANLVSGIYTHLWAEGTLDIPNPIKRMKHIWRVVAPEKRTERIPTLNMPVFWSALQSRSYRPSREAITIMTLSGWRNSAVRMMRWEQLDLDAGIYNVRQGDIGWKGFFGQMPLSDYVIDMLRERSKAKMDVEWVFPRRHGTKFPYLSRVGDSIKECCAELEVRYRPHDLRRGFSTAAKLVTNDIVLVGALLGHKWAVDKNDKAMTEEAITIDYTLDEMRTLRYTANRTTEILLQICRAKPMEDWAMALLVSRGFKPDEFEADPDLPEDDEVITESD